MSVIEVVYWLMWGFVAGLSLVLYLRVDWHDWGAVGLVTALFGATVLLTGIIYAHYGGDVLLAEANVLWKLLVLVGAPVAIVAYILGMIRDPVPCWQIVRRLAALAVALTVLFVLLDTLTRS